MAAAKEHHKLRPGEKGARSKSSFGTMKGRTDAILVTEI